MFSFRICIVELEIRILHAKLLLSNSKFNVEQRGCNLHKSSAISTHVLHSVSSSTHHSNETSSCWINNSIVVVGKSLPPDNSQRENKKKGIKLVQGARENKRDRVYSIQQQRERSVAATGGAIRPWTCVVVVAGERESATDASIDIRDRFTGPLRLYSYYTVCLSLEKLLFFIRYIYIYIL